MAEQRVEAYLAAVGADLRLPEPWASEVREELAVHLTDGVAEGVARGLAPDEASREVLSRLGPPAALARSLRAAHQTPRRLVAGMAGGAVAALGGAIRGTILGYGLIVAVAVLVLVAATMLHQVEGLELGLPGVPSTSWTDALAASGSAVGALFAARAATIVSARRSRRGLRRTGRWWAVPGALLLWTWAVFGVEAAISWPVVLALLAIPIAFAAGALIATDRTGPRILKRHILAAFAACVVLPMVALLALGSQTGSVLSSIGHGPYDSIEALWHAEGLDVVGRPAPPSMADAFLETSDGIEGGVASARLELATPGVLDGWSNLRLEAWRMTNDDFVVAPGQTAPFAAAPTMITDGSVTGSVDVDHTRGVEMYGLLLTATGRDGSRYVLWGPNGGQTAFRGTVWDWLTAP